MRRDSDSPSGGSVKRILKILALIVAVLVVILVVGVVALVLFFNPNDYKSRIDASLSNRLGRPVVIQGPIKWSVFPWLNVQFKNVTVANAKGFGDKPLGAINLASAGVRLLPLFKGRIDIGQVTLDGLRLRLTQHANGRNNWQSIEKHLQDNASTANQGDHQTSDDNTHNESFFSSLAVKSIAIKDAAIEYRDGPTIYRLSHAHLETGAIDNAQPFKMTLGARFAAPQSGLNIKLDGDTRVTPHYAASRYELKPLHLKMTATGSAVPGRQQTATLDGAARANLNAGTFGLSGTTIKTDGLNAKLTVDGHGLNTKPTYNGHVAIASFKPRDVLDKLGMPVAGQVGPKALRAAKLNADFTGSTSTVALKPLDIRLDDTRLTGSAGANLSTSAYRFDLHANQFNLDRYLASGGSSNSHSASHKGGKHHKNTTTPLVDWSFIKPLTLDGHLRVDRLTAYGMHLTNTDITVGANNGIVRIQPLKAALYGGHLAMKARADVRKHTPRYQTSGRVSGVRFMPLLKDLADLHSISGVGDARFDLSTAGNQINALEHRLDGTTGLDMAKGAIHGVDIREGLEAAARGQSFKRALAASKTTVFKQLHATFRIKNGVARGNDLTVAANSINARGHGRYDIPGNDLNYTLDVDVPRNAHGALERVAGLTVPIKLTGPLSAPRVGLDLQQLIRARANQKIDKLGKSLLDNLQGRSGGEPDRQQKSNQKTSKDRGEHTIERALSNVFGN